MSLKTTFHGKTYTMAEHDLLLIQKIKNLQRELNNTKQKLGEVEQLKKQFSLLQNAFKEIQEMAGHNPELGPVIQRHLQDKQIYTWFYHIKTTAHQTNNLLNDFNQDMVEATAFLETQRTWRNYSFPSHIDLITFLEETGFVFDIKTFKFRPNYMGVIDFSPLEKEEIILKATNDSWTIEPANIKYVISYLMDKRAPVSFKLENEFMRLLVKNSQTVKIEGQNLMIRRLDLIVKTKNGTVQND